MFVAQLKHFTDILVKVCPLVSVILSWCQSFHHRFSLSKVERTNQNKFSCDLTKVCNFSVIFGGKLPNYKLPSSEFLVIQMQEVSTRLGVPLSCVVPVKNYSEELELDPNCDILLLCAVQQMLRFADNYFDDISDQLSNMKVKE